MLLGAGFSLFAALDRVSRRGDGATSQDLRRVVARIRQGLTEAEALREWGALADVEAVERLVAVLALDRETTDLSRLIAEEARAIRKDVQRELVETMERREQQVWIPVTVATLLPGVVFIAIPFIAALDVFGQS
jgi:tight adherence protein C